MKFKVTKIEFDFAQEDLSELDPEYQQKITKDHLGIWVIDDEESLTDIISDESGWCIKSIEYNQISP